MPETMKNQRPQNYECCGRPKYYDSVNSYCISTVLHSFQVVLLYIIPLIVKLISNMTFMLGG